jgi:hypothetical protein
MEEGCIKGRELDLHSLWGKDVACTSNQCRASKKLEGSLLSFFVFLTKRGNVRHDSKEMRIWRKKG